MILARPAFLPLALLALLALLPSPTAGLYFLLGREREKCFVEEMPANTRAVGSYKNPDWSPADDLYVSITVRDIDDAEVYSQKAEVDGRFAFSSVNAGMYQICMKIMDDAARKSTGGWFGGRRRSRYCH